MLKNKISIAIIAVISALALQGCGGGSSQGDTVTPPPPAVNAFVITQQPVDASVIVGQKAIFSVAVNSAASVTYQWLKNQTPITGATDSTFTTDNTVIADDNAVYSVRISNANTSVTSQAAKLTVISKNVIAEHFGGKSIEGVEFDRVDGSLLGVDAQGAAYVLKQGLRVVKLSPDGTQLPFGDSPNGVQAAQVNRANVNPCIYRQAGGAVDAQGNVYVWHNTSEAFPVNGCRLTGGAVNKISADGKSNTVLIQSSINEPIVPLSVHPAATGDVYLKSAWGPKLFKIASGGVVSPVSNLGYETPVLSYFPNNPTEIPEVTVDEAGQVYVASYRNGQFFKLGSDGKLNPLPASNLAPGQTPVLLDRVVTLQWNTSSKKMLALTMPGTLPASNPETGPGMLLSVDPSTTTVSAIAGAPAAGAGDLISAGVLPGKLGGVTKFVYGLDGNIYAEAYVSPGVIKVYKILP
jgi:hypothetical protein